MQRDLIIKEVFEEVNLVDQSQEDAEAMIYTVLDKRFNIYDVQLAEEILWLIEIN